MTSVPAPVDVVVLDANSRAALVAIRSLGRAGLRVAAVECVSRPLAPAMRSRWTTSRHVVPDVWDDPDGYVDGVLAVARRTRAQVLLPAHDSSVAALRARRAEVEAVLHLALPAEPALRVLVDKTATAALARTLGVAVPRGDLVHDQIDLRALLDSVRLPAIVKPAQSWVSRPGGSADRLICSDVVDRAELSSAVTELLRAGAHAVVQEIVPGRREAVHLLARDGEVLASSAQATLRTYPPLGGSSVLRVAVPVSADLRAAASALVGATVLTGYAEVEFRRDAQGELVLMEVNPRLSASVEVAVRAGMDVPLMIWQLATGRPLAEPVPRAARMRWLGGDCRWLIRVGAERGRPQRPSVSSATLAFVTEFLRPGGYDYLGWRDPRPVGAAVRGFLRESRTRAVLGSDASKAPLSARR